MVKMDKLAVKKGLLFRCNLTHKFFQINKTRINLKKFEIRNSQILVMVFFVSQNPALDFVTETGTGLLHVVSVPHFWQFIKWCAALTFGIDWSFAVNFSLEPRGYKYRNVKGKW